MEPVTTSIYALVMYHRQCKDMARQNMLWIILNVNC